MNNLDIAREDVARSAALGLDLRAIALRPLVSLTDDECILLAKESVYPSWYLRDVYPPAVDCAECGGTCEHYLEARPCPVCDGSGVAWRAAIGTDTMSTPGRRTKGIES